MLVSGRVDFFFFGSEGAERQSFPACFGDNTMNAWLVGGPTHGESLFEGTCHVHNWKPSFEDWKFEATSKRGLTRQ